MRNDVYIYAAALYCEECGEKIRAKLTAGGNGNVPEDPDDETSYDSGVFPKGPYADGGGESDTPQHCAECHAFLENPLTGEGVRYVADAIERAIVDGKSDSVALTEWLPFYDVELSPRAIRLGRMSANMRKQADEKTGELPAYAWPGGYPIFYIVGDSECVCVTCANDHKTGLSVFGVEFRDVITAADCNWEDPNLWCDCGERIESAYAEDEAKGAESEATDGS